MLHSVITILQWFPLVILLCSSSWFSSVQCNDNPNISNDDERIAKRDKTDPSATVRITHFFGIGLHRRTACHCHSQISMCFLCVHVLFLF